MKIFQNKPSKAWKSSGVKLNGNQMEMSGFSFAEDYFKLTKDKFIINIIAKNIVGNGFLIVSVYKEQFLVWQENIYLKNTNFSKNSIEIEEQSNFEYKIVISRGRESKGKVLIDSVIINEFSLEKKKKEIDFVEEKVSPPAEDEPIFSNKNLKDLPKEIHNDILNNNLLKPKDTKIRLVGRIRKKKKENIEIKKDDETPKEEVALIPEKENLKKNNIWVMIIDFSEIKDERLVFKYLNQISFGKGKQLFLVKNNLEQNIDFLKYEHVTVCSSNDEIINKLLDLNPEKVTFPDSNLNQDILDAINKLGII
jgi:hypothetical protein